MASSTAVDQEAGPARPMLDEPARAAVRDAIRAEIARARPRPVAARTLELLALAAVEPADGPVGYRVLDRHGAPRDRPDGPAEDPAPMTLADLVAELRSQHPALFLPPEPEPEPAAAKDAQPKDSPLLAGASEMRAATARFVEVQSERARTLAERSSVQGRALAQSAAGRFATLRASVNARLARPAPAGPATVRPTPGDSIPAGLSATPEPDSAAAWNAGPGRFGEAVRAGLQGLRDRLDGPGDEIGRRHRRWLAGTGAAALIAVAAAGLVVAGRDPGTATAPQAGPQGGTQAGAQTPSQTARGPSAPDTVTPPPETGGDAEPDTAPPAPNSVTGPAQVIDTATLKLNGRVVHLFGVEWVRGGQAAELTRYLAGRPVTCQPAPGSESMNCTVDGRDLSEVVLFNGGGRASPEASPELVAAEDHARSERLGVWKR